MLIYCSQSMENHISLLCQQITLANNDHLSPISIRIWNTLWVIQIPRPSRIQTHNLHRPPGPLKLTGRSCACCKLSCRLWLTFAQSITLIGVFYATSKANQQLPVMSPTQSQNPNKAAIIFILICKLQTKPYFVGTYPSLV